MGEKWEKVAPERRASRWSETEGGVKVPEGEEEAAGAVESGTAVSSSMVAGWRGRGRGSEK